tara:strand:- start:1856 stop:2395 length:540 start_codon:yes stop_codon:yes gene_type:complete
MFITLGGDNVSYLPDTSTLASAIKANSNIKGIIYDFEGALKDSNSIKAQPYIAAFPNLLHVACPAGWMTGPFRPGNNISKSDGFTHIAPMMYSNDTSYAPGKFDVAGIQHCIDEAKKLGYATSEIIVTFQCESILALNNPNHPIINFFKSIKSKGFAGLLGWGSYTAGNTAKASDMIFA